MKNVLLLLANGFEIYEASAFIDVIGWNKTYGDKNTTLVTCGLSKEVVSTFNVPIIVDELIDNVDVSDFDALAIPGGFEPYGFYKDAYQDRFLEIIRKFNQLQKTVASICVGALPVAKSGVLEKRNATTYHLSNGKRQDQLKEFGIELVNKPIVIDGNIITSWAPSTALDVAYELLERLTTKKNCEEIKKLMGF